jgi:hypothetical protein
MSGCADFCQTKRLTRRGLLQAGALSAMGLSLPALLSERARGSIPSGKARSVILLWLYGGPSHIDTFDPKPAARSQVRGPFRPISTHVPGLHITEILPQLAQWADRFALIRSMHHDQSDHNVGGAVALTGVPGGGRVGGGAALPGERRPTLGSMVARLTGLRPGTWPPFMCIGAPTKVSGAASGQDAAVLGGSFEPFRVYYSLDHRVEMPSELTLLSGFSVEQLDDRRRLLAAMDRFEQRHSLPMDRMSQFYHQAVSLITSPSAKRALDLELEGTEVRDRYGRTRFGQSCLLARRLVEAGVSFVQVNWSDHGEDQQTSGGDGGWDHHWRLYEFLQDHCAWVLDQGLTALLDDLSDRGLLDETLVLAMGEFGRTPKINGCGGRDHWPGAYTVLLAGGGVQGGRVIGASDKEGAYPADRPVHPTNLHATALRALGLDRLALLPYGINLDADPVHELF